MSRRLSAILAADVVGYSRLMGEDQEGTLAALRRVRDEIISPSTASANGSIVKSMGDGWIIEFSSISNAIEAAFNIQDHLSDEETIKLRIGVHTGEVVFEDSDVFGDGVNIAARLEQEAEAGGILISDIAYHSLDAKTARSFANDGERNLKNIARPVVVWRWADQDGQNDAQPTTSAEPSEKPSIAVLPFNNMSGDPEQEFFADGMTEDLITDLSKIAGLFVVARNSTFVFKGQAVDVRDVARRLGVRYVLEGSVRKAGPRVRINAQLIDARDGGHLWAERYDGALEDVFELQDQVGAQVIEALSVRLTKEEDRRLHQVHTRNLEAYELYAQAKAMPYPPLPERIEAARELFAQVIEMDPEFAGGYAGVAWMLSFRAFWGHGDPSESVRQGIELAEKAIAIDPNFALSHVALSMLLALAGRHDEGLAASARATELQPNDAEMLVFQGFLRGTCGDPERGTELVDLGRRLNPQSIGTPYLNIRGLVRLVAGDAADAARTLQENIDRRGPVGPPALAFLAAALHEIGKIDEARQVTDRLFEMFPQFRLAGWNFMLMFKDQAAWKALYDRMHAAGVPD